MSKFLGLLAAGAVIFSVSHAAPIVVENGDFEDLTHILGPNSRGQFATGAAGFEVLNPSGGVGTFSANSGIYANVSDGTRVGVVNGGTTLYQDLGVSIEADTSYEFSGLFGNRLDYPTFGGVIGFFANGDPSNIIGQITLTDPSQLGVLELQSILLDSPAFANFVGQTLGIFITGMTTQVTFDNLAVNAESDLTTPIPGAVWLFGSALAAAGGMSRRKKQKQA